MSGWNGGEIDISGGLRGIYSGPLTVNPCSIPDRETNLAKNYNLSNAFTLTAGQTTSGTFTPYLKVPVSGCTDIFVTFNHTIGAGGAGSFTMRLLHAMTAAGFGSEIIYTSRVMNNTIINDWGGSTLGWDGLNTATTSTNYPVFPYITIAWNITPAFTMGSINANFTFVSRV